MSGCSAVENGMRVLFFRKLLDFFAFEIHCLVLQFLIKAGRCRRVPCIYLEAQGVSSDMASDFCGWKGQQI